MSKKAKKYRCCIDSKESDNISGKYFNVTCEGLHTNDKQFDDVPDYMYLGSNSGIPLAVNSGGAKIGLPEGRDGHIAVIGGSGSGKSSGIAFPTIESWRSCMCITDTKYELAPRYEHWYNSGKVKRPCIIFNPLKVDSKSYDPFSLVKKGGVDNEIRNIEDIVNSILPSLPDDKEPFWNESGQALLKAALLHYFSLGLSFSEAIVLIASMSSRELCETLTESSDVRIKMILGDLTYMKGRIIASIDRVVRNKLLLMATDKLMLHALRGEQENAECFSWDDLENYNIFLCIPEEMLDQWSIILNIMYTQLIRYIQQRPEKYSEQGKKEKPLLLLLDEFARYGKISPIMSAIPTLRSKNVNLCIIIQSIAQLDEIYGINGRKIIMDNCNSKVILRSNDSDTQKYLAELLGTYKKTYMVTNDCYDVFNEITSYTEQMNDKREYRIYPHEFSLLDDVILLTSEGMFRLQKYKPYENKDQNEQYLSNVVYCEAVLASESTLESDDGIIRGVVIVEPESLNNSDNCIQMLEIEERYANAKLRVYESEIRLLEENGFDDAEERIYSLGRTLVKHFPKLLEESSSEEEATNITFDDADKFFELLSNDVYTMSVFMRRIRNNEENDW